MERQAAIYSVSDGDSIQKLTQKVREGSFQFLSDKSETKQCHHNCQENYQKGQRNPTAQKALAAGLIQQDWLVFVILAARTNIPSHCPEEYPRVS